LTIRDQVADFLATGGRPALPLRILHVQKTRKAFAVPGNDCFGLHDDQRRTTIRPHSGKPNPQQAIGSSELWALLCYALQHADLMPQRDVLQL
jgi:hypothetical protein